MDLQSFAIIITMTTIVSYIIIRRYFKISPKYIGYAALGLVGGLLIGTIIAWPASRLFGEMGAVSAPYILGIILMIFIEAFIIDGKDIIKYLKHALR